MKNFQKLYIIYYLTVSEPVRTNGGSNCLCHRIARSRPFRLIPLYRHLTRFPLSLFFQMPTVWRLIFLCCFVYRIPTYPIIPDRNGWVFLYIFLEAQQLIRWRMLTTPNHSNSGRLGVFFNYVSIVYANWVKLGWNLENSFKVLPKSEPARMNGGRNCLCNRIAGSLPFRLIPLYWHLTRFPLSLFRGR